MNLRKLSPAEIALIIFMSRGKSVENIVLATVNDCFVRDMRDGGMGSIRFIHTDGHEGKFGREIVERGYTDVDGVPVSIALNFDAEGNLFELDFFKADNSQLKRYPSPNDLTDSQRIGHLS